MKKLTPLHVTILFDIYCNPHYRIVEYSSAAINNATADFVVAGVLEKVHGIEGKYSLTAKGKVFLDMILSTPLPVAVTTTAWFDPRNIY